MDPRRTNTTPSLLLAFALVLLLLTLSGAACAPRIIAYGELQRPVLVSLVQETSRLRELGFKEPVRFGLQHTEQEGSSEPPRSSETERRREAHREALLRALGVLKGPLSMAQADEQAMDSGMVFGYYAGRQRGVVIFDTGLHSDIGELEGLFTGRDPRSSGIVHELTHALQDQHVGLDSWFAAAQNLDEQNARRALVEGDASLVAALYDHSSPASQARLFKLLIGVGGRDAAAHLRRVALFSYADGLLFAAALHRTGGFDALNQAYCRPPRSSYEVLFPERYRAGFTPQPVTLPDAPGELLLAERLGALLLKDFLRDLGSGDERQRLLRAWRGDRAELRRGGPRGQVARWGLLLEDERSAARLVALARERCPGSRQEGKLALLSCSGEERP